MANHRTTFTDHTQTAAHAAKSAKFIVDTDALDVLTRGEDGQPYSLVERSEQGPAKDPRELVSLIRSWKGVAIGPTTADDMMGKVFEEYAVPLTKEDIRGYVSAVESGDIDSKDDATAWVRRNGYLSLDGFRHRIRHYELGSYLLEQLYA
jgi:hypothetical protein